MSLWEVEEKSAVTLAENFFKYRKSGKTKLESLKSARDDIRNAGYKHPVFWSASSWWGKHHDSFNFYPVCAYFDSAISQR